MKNGYTKERNLKNFNDYSGISYNTDVRFIRICCMRGHPS